MINIETIKNVSLKDGIPIIRDNTIKYICNFINEKHYISYLEIGSGYGFSAINIAFNTTIQTIVSLEKDTKRYNKCFEISTNDKIKYINIDAFEYQTNQTFDAILIDGPKSHQDILLEKYIKLLNPNGTIFIDNVYLKKFNRNILTPNQKKLIEKNNSFFSWLFKQTKYKTQLVDIDDGLAVITL